MPEDEQFGSLPLPRRAPAAETAFDVGQRFVRLLNQREDGLIEFEFAVGDPDVFVELVLNPTDFRAFCRMHGTTTLPSTAASTPGAPNQRDLNWRISNVTRERKARDPMNSRNHPSGTELS